MDTKIIRLIEGVGDKVTSKDFRSYYKLKEYLDKKNTKLLDNKLRKKITKK